jgi:hypothetical protein
MSLNLLDCLGLALILSKPICVGIRYYRRASSGVRCIRGRNNIRGRYTFSGHSARRYEAA